MGVRVGVTVGLTADPSEAVGATSETHEFALTGGVFRRAETRDVYVGGSPLGWFAQKDIPLRNILLVVANRAIEVDTRKLAKVFGIAQATERTFVVGARRSGFGKSFKPSGVDVSAR